MAKKKKEMIIHVEVEAEGWMVSFADLLSLLVCFFVLLLSMTSMDNQKYRESFGMLISIPGAMSSGGSSLVETAGVVPMAQRTPISGENLAQITSADEARTELEKLLATLAVHSDLLTLDHTTEGICVRFRADLLFAGGSDILSPLATDALNKLAPLLSRIRFPMRVIGHAAVGADGTEPSQQMRLSMQRANAVLEQLTQRAERPVAESKFTLEGRGAQSPLPVIGGEQADPSDPRQQRVDLIIETEIEDFVL